MAEVKLMKKNSSGKYVSVTDEYSEDFIENVNGKGGASTVTFAVKKGGKYALRVYLLGDFILNSRFKKASDAGGKKKSTAKALKKGKAQYGLLFMGKTQSRWYKIKAPNSKPMTIQFKGWGNGYMKYQIKVKGLGTVTREIYQNNWDHKKGDTTFRENNKIKEMKATLSKGTVAYIRVYNTHKRYGGYYMLKWK